MFAAVYDRQRRGQYLLFLLTNFTSELSDAVINALTGWDNFIATVIALAATKDSDRTRQRDRHGVNLEHVKRIAIGISGVAQVETATVAGTVTGSGNATVVVTAAGMTGSPKTISVAVLNGDTAAVVAGKIRAALAADTAVTAMFQVSGATTAVVLTRTALAANDGTLNISVDNGTCTGLTTAATSANTTAGAAQGAAAADAVVVAWTNRADAIAYAQALQAHSPGGNAPQSSFIQ